ncbi:MAG TPA: 3-hydroxyacyl-CoA dehydrogenase family protein [Victivallales bacterium]|nr:3-hydroxyacyl-CoA dehydrogenase family protein [Victivallales bacterium]
MTGIKKVGVLSNDSPEFVSIRIFIPMINEAILVLQVQIADFIELDICLSIIEVLCKDLDETKYRPAPLLKRMVAAGYLGKITGRDFYEY